MSLAALQVFCKWHHGNRNAETHISKNITQEQLGTQEHTLLFILYWIQFPKLWGRSNQNSDKKQETLHVSNIFIYLL